MPLNNLACTIIRSVKKIKNMCWRSVQSTKYNIDLILSRLFYKKNILEQYTISDHVKNENICIFSHYDKHNVIDPYVEYYLRALSKAGCDIVFVTTSTTLHQQERTKIERYCKKIIVHKNRGRDFGAFKCGIESESNLSFYKKLILANDSVYGPFFDLTELLTYGETQQMNMWGATDSLEHRYHIQSYFVVFDKSIINSQTFKYFWKKVCYLAYRDSIIYHYEIGMSQYFLRCGFKLGALCQYTNIRNTLLSSQNNQPADKNPYINFFTKHPIVNSTHYLWDAMITHYQYPFIKRELLLHNPRKININNFVELIKKYTQYDPLLITQHLDRNK